MRLEELPLDGFGRSATSSDRCLWFESTCKFLDDTLI